MRDIENERDWESDGDREWEIEREKSVIAIDRERMTEIERAI